MSGKSFAKIASEMKENSNPKKLAPYLEKNSKINKQIPVQQKNHRGR